MSTDRDTTDRKVWLVAWAAWRSESRARDGLQQRGYDVLVPTHHVTVRHAGRKMLVERPIFPRYLFVGVERGRSFYPILSTVSVTGLVMNHGKPVEMPTWIIRNLRAAQDDGAFDKPVEAAAFVEGQNVRFVGGAMENFIGRIMRAPPGKRVTVLIDMFGHKRELSVPLDQLVAA
jgi:transcription antitermination factor NusG